MGSKGSNTTTETKSYQADPRAAAYATWLTGQAQGLPGPEMVPLMGVEGFHDDQLAAFQGVRDAQGMYNPYAQRAEALNAEFGRGLNTQGVQDMYSQLSKGPLEQLWAQQRAEMARGTRNAVQAAGGTGASRIGVAQGNIANQQNLATGALQSGLLGQSIGAYQNDLAMKGAAAAQEANLGMGHTGQTYNDLAQRYGIGSAQQGLGQSRLNAAFQQLQQKYQNPYVNMQTAASIAPYLTNVWKGTETTEKEVPEASPWGTLLGAGLGAAGSFFGGPAGGALLSNLAPSLFGGGGKKADGGRVGGGYANGGAVNPFAPRSGLFDQMVKEYFPKNNPMTGMGAATTKAGGPFNGLVSQNATMGFADGGGVDILRSLFNSDEGQRRLADISALGAQRFSDDAPREDFDTRFNPPSAPDLYDPGVVADRNAMRDAGYNSPYRTEPMSEGDDEAPPLPQARPPFEMFNRNPLRAKPDTEERLAYTDEAGGGGRDTAGGRQLPPMPDTEFTPPERNPYGAMFNALAAALSKHGERMPSGHLVSGTFFGQAARAAGAGLDAGMKTHAAGREEDRKNYQQKLSGERLSEQAAMARLPYDQMTPYQQELVKNQRLLAEKKDDWSYLGPSSRDPNKSIFLNRRDGSIEEREGAIAAKPVNRVLQSPIRKDLEAKGSVISQIGDLQGGFREDYGGPAPEWVGSLQNYAARQFGIGNTDKASWWQQYDQYANVARNKLFGSALTAVEYNAWKAATIVPGMDPEMIRKNLKIQKEQTEKAARKLGLSLTKEGYSRDAIETQLGIDLEPKQGGDASPDAPPIELLQEGKNTSFKNGQVWTLQNGAPVRVK